MNKRRILLLCGLLSIIIGANAQRAQVSVNNLTGTANVNIPITTISSDNAVVPISLIYSATGLRVKDVEGSAGMGWHLSAGGRVSRQLRGLPDDIYRDEAGSNRYGWLRSIYGTTIEDFTITNNGACASWITDLAYMNTYMPYPFDTEPDIFNINAPGLSCQVVFDAAHVLHTLSKQDVKITFTSNSTTGRIETFKAVNNQGVTYEFNIYDEIWRTSKTTDESGIAAFKNDYVYYKNGIKFSNNWYLTKITDANGNQVSLSYEGYLQDNSQDFNLYIPNSGSTALKMVQYSFQEFYTYQVVNSITNAATTVNIKYMVTDGTKKPIITEVALPATKYLLSYFPMRFNKGNYDYNRYFLNNIIVADTSFRGGSNANISSRYDFKYKGQHGSSFLTNLPDSTSFKIDYWGYFNNSSATSLLPEILVNSSDTSYSAYALKTDNHSRSSYPYTLSGSPRAANAATVATGALDTIIYNQTGYTRLEYESNDFYDPTAAAVVQGGGIRIKRIVYFDGADTTKNIIRNYSYNDPFMSASSGKPLSMPVYALTRRFTASGTATEKWNWSTLRSDLDLSPEDHSIVYSWVTESSPGAGKTVYNYSNPGTYWDAAFSDWAPTINYYGNTDCIIGDFTGNRKYNYPFAPNVNYDFQRGLLQKIIKYNAANTKVSETALTYARTATGMPNYVAGLVYTRDQDTSTRFYAKYNTYTDVDNLTVKDSTIVYDLATPTNYHQSVNNYYYTSAYHKLLTSQVSTNSDGKIIASKIKYVKDYAPTSSADSTENGLYNLQLKNMNIPIESYTQVTTGGSTRTVKASLTKFKMFDVGSGKTLPLASKSYSYDNAEGITGFTVSGISSSVFTMDSHYVLKGGFSIYDYNGYPQTSYNNRRQVQSVITDRLSKMPVAAISNASVNEIAYSNFSGQYDNAAFSLSNTASTVIPDTRTGAKALSLHSSTVLSRSINKNATANNYVFSTWINTGSTGHLTITLVNGGTSHAYTLAFANTAGAWKYTSLRVPMTGMSPGLTVNVQSSVNIKVSEVLFYPDVAEAGTMEYQPETYFKLTETNTNGKASYYDYDYTGRLIHARDQDKNIILQRSYVLSNNADNYTVLPDPAFVAMPTPSVYVGDTVKFSPINYYYLAPYPGITFSWDFGDGTTSTLLNPAHAYSTANDYTVTFTATASGFTGVSSTQRVHVAVVPPPPVAVTLITYAVDGSGNFNRIRFYKDGILAYSFSGSALNDIKVPPAEYTIEVGVLGSEYDPTPGTGYLSVRTYTNSVEVCKPYFHSGSYTFSSVDLTSAGIDLQIIIHTDACP